MKIQVTLFSTMNYKPIGTIINVETIEDFKNNKQKFYNKAIENICHNNNTTWKALKENGFTQVKFREYKSIQDKREERLKQIQKIKELQKK